MRNYNLTPEQYTAMLDKQDGGCAICGARAVRDKNFAVDHDHRCCPGKKSCGRCVRGLLCSPCNVSLGAMDDDPARLMAAAQYIERAATRGRRLEGVRQAQPATC